MPEKPRQPWGKGRAAKLKKKRNKLACTICDLLRERLDYNQIQLSCELFPRGSLKKRNLKAMFAWCGDSRFIGRLFTKHLCTSIARKLCHCFQLQPPPGESFQHLIKTQSSRLKTLVAAAKKLQAWIFL